MYYLGLDVGTSSLKVTLMDEACDIVYEASYPYVINEVKEGFREIDPEVWFQAVKAALHDVVTKFKGKKITRIGVTGQMHTTIFLDQNNQPVRNAIMWTDIRTAGMVEPLKEELTKVAETKYIAKILSPGCPAMNTLWVKEHEPAIFAKIRKIMTPYDYIVYRLTGNHSCDYCDASTSSMYDIVSKQWSQYMLEKLGITESYLGEVHASCDVIGNLLPELCNELSIDYEIPVIAGTGDNPANAVALGLLEKKQPVISLGTSGVVIMTKADQDFDGKGKNVLFKGIQNQFINVVQGTVRCAGGTHKWWVENIVKSNDMMVDQNDIEKSKLGKNAVLFFPHITGDKILYHDMNARGAFLNLSANTKREDMTQAVFEGVSFALKEVLENMNLKTWPQRIQINGGGSKSAIWMQIMANVLNCELEVVSMNATPGFGACLLARMVDTLEMAKDIKHGVLYFPEKEIVDAYKPAYMKYKRIYKALYEVMQA